MNFRLISPTDVDRFIQLPETLDVDARSILLTVEEDTMKNYEKEFLIMDYVIISDIPKSSLFNSGMDWKYNLFYKFDQTTGEYLGVHVEDAHDPAKSGTQPLATDIILDASAKAHLSGVSGAARFSHYKQCNRFFKYSFKVGDSVAVSGHNAQLYGVYLDDSTGAALPYFSTQNPNAEQAAEVMEIYYADGIDLTQVVDAAGTQISYTDVRSNVTAPVELICPPHPELLETTSSAYGGPLAISASGATPILREVGTLDASNNFVQVPPESIVLKKYTDASGVSMKLMLYWVAEPVSGKNYLGEHLYVSFSDKEIAAAPTETSWGPIRDMFDASGNVKGAPASAADVKPVDRFVLTGTGMAASTLRTLESGISKLAICAPRMHMPASRFVVRHIRPSEPDVHNNGQDQFDVPLAYDVANQTSFDNDARKAIIGGRLMQLVSQYMFDSATDKEIKFFPFMLNESKELTDKVVNQLAALIKTNSTGVSGSRTDLLNQILIKHGKRYFEEYAVLNELTGIKTGNVWDVIRKIDDMFLMFTITLTTTVSNRSKDRVDLIRMIQVPIVLRIWDDSNYVPPATPTPTPTPAPTATPTPTPTLSPAQQEVVTSVNAMPKSSSISWYLDGQNSLSYTPGNNAWSDARSLQQVVTLSNVGTTPSGISGVAFNGNNTYGTSSQIVGFGASGLTVMAFYYRTGNPATSNPNDALRGGALFSINASTGSRNNALQLYEKYAEVFSSSGLQVIGFGVGITPTDNAWNFRGFSWKGDGSRADAYAPIAGTLVNFGANTSNTVSLGNSNIVIGIDPYDNYDALNGTVGLYIVYNSELSQSEVQSIYDQYKSRFGMA